MSLSFWRSQEQAAIKRMVGHITPALPYSISLVAPLTLSAGIWTTVLSFTLTTPGCYLLFYRTLLQAGVKGSQALVRVKRGGVVVGSQQGTISEKDGCLPLAFSVPILLDNPPVEWALDVMIDHGGQVLAETPADPQGPGVTRIFVLQLTQFPILEAPLA